MRGGMVKGLVTGAILGSAAATLYGVMNWQSQRRLNHMANQGGRWVSNKTNELFGKK